ncbi:hypothetical protein [Acholeplasma equifetale]|uniref:hypothetical protein n=1 Tax=Acholeplasma equifetale TaxID=264634 RepID=UPI000555D228|nr:hypothetical protein [Acholeplasma equifetale]
MDQNFMDVLKSIWETILSWFENSTGWLDNIIKPITDPWWQGAFDYFNSFPGLLQLVIVGFGILLLVLGLFSLIKKSLKLVITILIVVLIIMILNG